MDRRIVFVCVVLVTVLFLFAFVKLRFGYKHTMEGDTSDSNHTVEGYVSDNNMEGNTSDSKPRLFLYATQTESCLPIRLQKTLGNPNECNCDVLVLSYKKSCKAVFPPHIKHINGFSLTWPDGRNQLWQVTKSLHTQYIYYIFMDDDVVLSTTKGRNPWRQFERFLINVEPAIAAVEIDNNPFFRCREKAMQHNKCVVEDKAGYFTTAKFDAAFNAFHYQTLDYLFPYSNNHIQYSWRYASVHMAIKCEVTFRGHMVLPTYITAHNAQHRPYPRILLQKKDVLIIVPEVAEEIPSKYRNNSVLQGWKRDGFMHGSLSSTYCLPPPTPHMPIKPFALLEAPIRKLK